MTLEACQAFCSAYTYFGVEYSRECYCGNSLNAGSVAAPATDCSMTCMGAPSQYCGAGNRLSVYAGTGTPQATTTSATPVVTGLPEGWDYQGCWIDGNQGRILQYQVPDSQTNSPAACANACLAAGYTVSGTEYAVQCFCGNAVHNGGVKTADSDCNAACPGAPGQICGAGDRMSIVANGTP